MDVSREYAGATVVGRVISMMGSPAPWLGRILLGGMSVEKPRIALGAAGYALATRSDDGVGQVLGVDVVLCMGLVGDPSFNLPVLFLES